MAEEWARARARAGFELTSRCAAAARPTPSSSYLIFQTLVGAWPIEPERLEAYMEKALREAKRNTNWIEPDEEYEAAVKAFCARARTTHRAFLRRLRAVRAPRSRRPASAPRSASCCSS